MASFKLGQLVRQFSTSSVSRALVNPPIQVYGIEGRYATALFSAAAKEKKLDAVENEIKSFQNLLRKDVHLTQYILNPSLQRQEKKAVLGDVLTKQKMSSLLINLCVTMAENGRLNKLQGVLGAYQKMMSAHRGEVTCTVTTAKPLDSGNLKDLQSALQGFLKKGESLQLECQVDPSLIGGMVVNIGDKYVDMSMATKIKNYTNLIKEAV
ncbi:ATP synthase subunit O, mitochondrial-like [Liolophura sinensis]|uniref:ATP synthase subunit O, mitochondrial-like n=1 Tax=Liolophura sinensis TaxID=3198878 RepID=UPI003158C603